jgi:hypothetical protein
MSSNFLESSQVSEDSTLIEVREHIEAMIEGFLGESLDSAHVDRLYDDIQCMAFILNIYCFLSLTSVKFYLQFSTAVMLY